MANKLIEKQKKLYTKLMDIMYSNEVEENDKITSIYNVVNAVNNEMKDFNDVLIEDNKNQIEKINKNSKELKMTANNKKIPKLIKMVGCVTDKDNMYIKLLFGNLINIPTDFALIGINELDTIYAINSPFDEKDINNFINVNYEVLKRNFDSLRSFKEKYPNIGLNFEYNPKKYDFYQKKYGVGNDFLTYKVNLLNPMDSTLTFTDANDSFVSTNHSNKFGILYDYIETYNDEFMKKTLVNIDELDSLIKKMYFNNLKRENSNKLILKNK